jgi:sec-independent protein translocase protein TatC
MTGDGSFWEHLEELRKRLLIMIAALVLTTAVAFVFSRSIMGVATIPAGGTLLALSPAEAVTASLKLSLVAGAVVSSPVILMQIWMFIAPGLYRNERRAFLAAVASCLLLFIAGAAFAWFVMLRPTLLLFRSFETGVIHGSWSVSGYISFMGMFLLVFGAAFQLPLAVMLLTKLGVVSPQTLGKARKHVVIALLVVSALITPPDPVTQVILALPLYLLFELSLLLAVIARRSPKKP